MNVRHYGKVIERRWRRGRPLQRTATPRVTGQVAVQVTVTDRHVVLNQLAQNTAGNQRCAARCNHQHWVELRIDLLAQTTGHTHEAQHVQRHKCYEEANDPEPERAFTPFLVQREAERFWPPVGYASEAAEDHATDDNVMEVRNQEQTVVQNEVSTGTASSTPVIPPTEKVTMKPMVHSMAEWNTIRPRTW